MRVVVMAYQDIGYVCLDELLALRAEVALVVTHPDPAHESIWFRSVAVRARQAGLPVLLPPSVNAPDVVATIAGLAPDFLFSFYFREIVGPEVLGLRGGERSICMGRFCRATGAAVRSTGC